MTDLIKRIDALNAVAKAECGQRFNFERCLEDGCSCQYIWAIKDCPAVEPEKIPIAEIKVDYEDIKAELIREYYMPGEWIPVDDKWPDAGKHVLVTVKWADDDYEVFELDYGVTVYDAARYDDEWAKNVIKHIIAWQPLPKPYKEGGSDV